MSYVMKVDQIGSHAYGILDWKLLDDYGGLYITSKRAALRFQTSVKFHTRECLHVHVRFTADAFTSELFFNFFTNNAEDEYFNVRILQKVPKNA